MISKKDFCTAIENLRIQVVVDKLNSTAIMEALGIKETIVFDNAILFKTVLMLLQRDFPRDSDGFCEIEHYCFFIEFGREGFEAIISPEDLYDRLKNKTI